MMRDRFAGADAQSVRAVKRGQGRIIERNGAKVAAYRDQATGDAPLRDLRTYGVRRGLETAERTWIAARAMGRGSSRQAK
jgi:hypothetical protein